MRSWVVARRPLLGCTQAASGTSSCLRCKLPANYTPVTQSLLICVYLCVFVGCCYACVQMAVALGGRIAEELIFGENDITTGASNDFQQVSHNQGFWGCPRRVFMKLIINPAVL